MRPQQLLTTKAQEDIERMWEARHEAIQVLDLVVAEWNSDPLSVQCFDARTVERGKAAVATLRALMPQFPDYF